MPSPKDSRPFSAFGRVARILAPAALIAAPAAVAATTVAPSGAFAAGLTLTQVWSHSIADGANVIALSSPTEATVDSGGPSVVVGDLAGDLYALHLSNGSVATGFPISDGGVPIDTAPSSSGSTVFVGEGNATNQYAGGMAAYDSSGRLWLASPSASGGAQTVGVDSGLAVGTLQGTTGVVGGAMGQYVEAVRASNGGVLPGWPLLNADSDFATPAIADLYTNGVNEVIEGGDSTANAAVKDQLGHTYTNGGHIRVVSQSGQLMCEYNTNQVVQSSPAVGEFLSGGKVGIVAGTGSYYSGASNTDQLLAVDNDCQLQWAATLDGLTTSSPALVDALGNGSLQIAEGTNIGGANATGSVWLLNGAGQTIWHVPALGAVLGGVVSMPDPSGTHQDIVVATTKGAEILDGLNGSVLWTGLEGTEAFQNAPLVTDDPNGTVGITFAGYSGSGSDVVHYEVAGSSGAGVGATGSWPSFHHDSQLTGDAGTPQPQIEVPCKAPASPDGYYMAGSDGGIFNYGNLPFCGSTGDVDLAQPIVAMAATPDGGGYWLVASDGGVFAFGDAKFYGSTGGVHLDQPIVGMAPTADGKGYYLVAADGGVFAFGDAKFYGSTGGVRLDKPIVAMATDPAGGGYWMVASDGGVFSFGAAKFHGSTGGVALVKPVVGMAATASGNGYWLVASDGGLFNYGDAQFHGSTGGVHLNKPVVAMARTADGGGYWMVASDGGVFAFGDAKFHGSTGGVQLAKPVVAMAALGD